MENICRIKWWVRSNKGKECKNVIFSRWGGLKVSDQNTDLCGSLIHPFTVRNKHLRRFMSPKKLGLPSYNAVFISGCDKITLNLICNIKKTINMETARYPAFNVNMKEVT
jgi:hypothetical protein